MRSAITVLKFGGSVLQSEKDLPLAVHEIYRRWRRGSQVLAVASAFGGKTDELIDRSKAYGDEMHPEAFATLLHTEEATSAALLGLALQRAGIPSKLLNPYQVGIRTVGDRLNAEPVSADLERLRKELDLAVVVVSGFAGIDDGGDLTLLGRGGTDLTALFLAQQLDARCVLLKDVDGMYESSPSNVDLRPRRFLCASYGTTLRIAGELVQTKAVRFAEAHKQSFEVAALGKSTGTTIGHIADEFADAAQFKQRPLRVALLGCGTVGGGVFQRLSALPGFFEIAGVVNLDPRKAVAAGIDSNLLTTNSIKLIEDDCDVVVELIGGIEPARSLIKHALHRRRHVVTANKALLAADGPFLNDLARSSDVSLCYSASVGGSLPALEAVTGETGSIGPRSISGIINGTCNFVLDQLASGADYQGAVRLAQQAGFAEADPTLDLDGTDTAQKLILLARASFGVDVPFAEIRRRGIDRLVPAEVVRAYDDGRSYRLVAECRRTENGLEASVKPVSVPRYHPFAITKGADNCLLIESQSGHTKCLRGRGAGRYATAEAVIADLFDLRRSVRASGSGPRENRSFQEVPA